jgi:hypothetical protein
MLVRPFFWCPLIIASLVSLASCSRGDSADSESTRSSSAAVDDTSESLKDSPDNSSAAQPGQECVRGEPEPLLTGDVGGQQPTFTRTGRYTSTESVQLDGDIRFTIEQSGCAHYVEELTFFVSEPIDARNTAGWLAHAAQLLSTAPFKKDERQGMNSLAGELDKAAKVDAAGSRTVSISESESATVTIERSGSGTKLTIVHDVAL